MHDSKISRLLTKFENANQIFEVKEYEDHTIESLINDKIGRYYFIHDILFKWDEALSGKHESSPAKQYKNHVKNTLDSFESSVKLEAARRKLTYNTSSKDSHRNILFDNKY